MPSLYAAIDLCGRHLLNRVFMAPLTRNLALPDGTPDPWAETYYRQRASQPQTRLPLSKCHSV
jgi:2,4-dienoyl-CoA reductase-like NADH-dependent reductase (Old Yellow Enzyme family)